MFRGEKNDFPLAWREVCGTHKSVDVWSEVNLRGGSGYKAGWLWPQRKESSGGGGGDQIPLRLFLACMTNIVCKHRILHWSFGSTTNTDNNQLSPKSSWDTSKHRHVTDTTVGRDSQGHLLSRPLTNDFFTWGRQRPKGGWDILTKVITNHLSDQPLIYLYLQSQVSQEAEKTHL